MRSHNWFKLSFFCCIHVFVLGLANATLMGQGVDFSFFRTKSSIKDLESERSVYRQKGGLVYLDYLLRLELKKLDCVESKEEDWQEIKRLMETLPHDEARWMMKRYLQVFREQKEDYKGSHQSLVDLLDYYKTQKDLEGEFFITYTISKRLTMGNDSLGSPALLFTYYNRMEELANAKKDIEMYGILYHHQIFLTSLFQFNEGQIEIQKTIQNVIENGNNWSEYPKINIALKVAIANYFYYNSKWEEALNYYKEAAMLSNICECTVNILDVLYFNLALCYEQLGKPLLVLENTFKSLKHFHQNHIIDTQFHIDILELSSRTYEKLGDYCGALSFSRDIEKLREENYIKMIKANVADIEAKSQVKYLHQERLYLQKSNQQFKFFLAFMILGLILLSALLYLYLSKSRRLKRVLDLKEDLYAVMAHDLISPLSAANFGLGKLHLELEGNADPKVLRRISNIKDTLIRLYQTVENLLEWSKMELNYKGNDKEKSVERIGPAVQRAIDYYEEQAKNKGVDMVFIDQTEQGIIGSRSLEVILRNLIDNSLKYAQCSQISIKAEEGSGCCTIWYKDNGKGMSPERIEYIRKFMDQTDVEVSQDSQVGFGFGIIKKHLARMVAKLYILSNNSPGFYCKIQIER